jgi:uncharacterized protein (TIGR03083 family)
MTQAHGLAEADPATARALVELQWRAVLGTLSGAADPVWTLPTRCDGWTVTDLAAHAVWGVSMEADAIRLARGGSDTPAAGVDADGLGPDRLPAALERAVDDLLDELGHLPHDVEGLVAPLSYGPLPVSLALDVFVTEASVHRSDLAAALGEDDTLPHDAVHAVATTVAAFVPVLGAASTAAPPPDGTVIVLEGTTVALRLAREDGGWSAHAAPVTASGAPEANTVVRSDDSSLLLRVLGRRSADDPALAVIGDARHADALKAYLPGP